MKQLSQRDRFIKDNIDQYIEYHMIITDEVTGRKEYRVLTNLHCDPFHFIDINDCYEKCFYIKVNEKQFFKRFNKYKTVFIEHYNSSGYDRVVYKVLFQKTRSSNV